MPHAYINGLYMGLVDIKMDNILYITNGKYYNVCL